MTKDLQGHMDQKDQEEFRALVDLQGIQAQRDFKEIRVSQVLLVLMVLQEPLVLDSKVLRVKGARKEGQALQDRLELVNPDSQVPVVLKEHQERGAYQEKDFQDQRGKRVLKDQLAHKDYKACQSKGIRGIWDLWDPRDQQVFLALEVKASRGSKVQLVHLVHKDPQDKAHLVLREK